MPSDPTLYLYTSLTAGSSHIITATSRIEVILKGRKIPFKAIDCATDEKARLIWSRRSKGKELPGLVKYNDVIADLDQIEEWNEHGELEDELDDVVDIFGDVPVSATVTEAHAAASARASAQSQGSSSQARTASETRHISISDPKEEKKKSEASPMTMALRNVGVEAAAKAGQKKTTPTQAAPSVAETTPASASAPAAATLPETQEPSSVTESKAPSMLASEGTSKASTDRISIPATAEEDTPTKSTLAQTLDQKRKSSVPSTPSALSQTTSITEAHTLAPSNDKPRVEKPATQHRGSGLDPADAETIREIEKKNSIAEKDEEDEDESESRKKGGVTDKTGSSEKTQKQDAGDATKAGVSVGD